MAKRDRLQNPKTHAQWAKDGRGQGTGRDYKPWLSIHDFAGITKCSRIKGWKTGRTHGLFSPLEVKAFYLLDWEDDVTDIREQFPIPLEATIQIAQSLRIPHPKSGGGFSMLPTTFLINRGTEETAISVTPKEPKKRHAILKAYWEGRGISHHVWTENEIDAAVAQNIEWVHPYRGETPQVPEEELFVQIATGQPLKDVARSLDKHHGTGSTIRSIRCLIAQKQWEVDMTSPISIQTPLTLLKRHADQELHHRVA